MAGSSTNNSEESVFLVQKQNTGKGPQATQPSNFQPQRGTRLCGNCGCSHNSLSNCRARCQTCQYCKKPSHFAEVCRSKPQRQRFHSLEQAGSQASQTKAESTLSAAFELVVFESITIAGVSLRETSRYRDEVFVSINLNLPQDTHKNTILKAKLDTGAQGNILPMRLYCQMYPHNLDDHGSLRPGSSSSADVILTAYCGAQIKHHGTVTIPCSYKGENARASFYVTDTPGPAIIGLPTSTDLKLLTLNFCIEENDPTPRNSTVSKEQPIKDKQDLISQYPECFNGVGKFQGEYHIVLDPNVPAVVHPPRRMPISLKDDIKRELDEMVNSDIITTIREGEPTQWVNSLVYRRKQNGRLRLCLDPKDLNAAIQREHHVTPTLEEILPKLANAKVFSIVDAKCGYWNVVLDKESSYLTTFNWP